MNYQVYFLSFIFDNNFTTKFISDRLLKREKELNKKFLNKKYNASK